MNITRCGYPTVEELYFHWHLTNWCNYKCSYCPVLTQIHNNFSIPDHTVSPKITLARLSNVEKDFNICLTGGESTLHPELFDIIASLEAMPNCCGISFFTNFSRGLSYFKRYSERGFTKTTITASYHPEYADDDFLDKVIEVRKLDGISLQIDVSMSDNPALWSKLKDFMDSAINANVRCHPTLLVRNNNWKPNYTQEFFDIFTPYFQSNKDRFKEIPCTFSDGSIVSMRDYEIEFNGWNKFKGWTCTPGTYQITMEGEIRNTCTRKRMPILLSNKNIVKEEVCPNDVCQARSLLRFPKHEI